MRLDLAQGQTRDDEAGPERAEMGQRRADTPRRASRPGPFSAAWLAGMRLSRGWTVLLAVAVGMLVAVVLICSVPLYDALVADLQLQRTLAGELPSGRNVQIQVDSPAITASVRDAAAPVVAGLARQYASSFTGATPTYYTASDDMLLPRAGAHTFSFADSQAPQVRFEGFDLAAAASHMRFVAGAAPSASPATGAVPEGAITKQMADQVGVKVGDTLSVTQFGDHSIRLSVRVAGIWAPTDVNDPYWNGLRFDVSPNPPFIYPVLVTYDTFFAQLNRFNSVAMTQRWIYYTRPDALTVDNIAAVADNVGNLRSHLSGTLLALPGIAQVRLQTNLDTTIQDIQRQQALLALPLYVIVAQVVGLALLFVSAMAGLLIEGQSMEIATLKSRGASGTQLLGAYTTQGMLLAVIALVAGPFLAAALALALLRLFIPTDVLRGTGVGPAYLAHVASPASVAVPAVIGALLGVGAVAFSAFQSARMDVLAARREQGRATHVPLWRRYYLDIALAVLCVAGYLDLNQFGGTATRQQLTNNAGGAPSGASPLLLVTPALLLLAGALLVLRVFPLGAGLGARVAARANGATPLLALAQVERNPGRYGRLTLLLVLAVGLGLFALTFDASLLRDAHDRATYTVGTDVRVDELLGQGEGSDAKLAARIAALPGVRAVSPAYRVQAGTTPDLGGEQLDLLGIDPATFDIAAGQVSWRDDYASVPLAGLLGGMRAHVHGDSAGTAAAPVWALVSDTFAARYHVRPGDTFTLLPPEVPFQNVTFTVGAVVHEFPTLYPTREVGGFVVVDMSDYFSAVKANLVSSDTSELGANEFWVRASPDPSQRAALIQTLQQPEFGASRIANLADEEEANASNPISAGMRGLLLVGAITAALLAVLGSIIQSLLAARQRARQFAVLRTFGMSGRQLTGLLLGEQIVVYFFGLLGGTILGVILVTATLPFLQFSDSSIDATRLGVPPYILAFNAPNAALFYAALLLAFAVALAIAARYATRLGLGSTLRLGED
ncbi:MAG TPA: ABC transporter permease [Ktedonobacterales bacterium]|nr:ABC transporter permease [Ktedonobacterales bacterium]